MNANNPFLNRSLARRAFLAKAMGAAGSAAALHLKAAEPPTDSGADYLKELEENERKSRSKDARATIGIGDKLKRRIAVFFAGPPAPEQVHLAHAPLHARRDLLEQIKKVRQFRGQIEHVFVLPIAHRHERLRVHFSANTRPGPDLRQLPFA